MEQTKRGFFEAPPQTMFAFGIAVGVTLTVLIGLLLGGVDTRTVQAPDEAVLPTAQQQPTPTAKADMPVVTEDDHVRGDLKKAKVVMVEYSDFECPFCSRHHPTMVQAVADYGDDVAWVYRHFPLSFHPQAMPAAEVSECAADQGKFWEMADALFENQATLGDATYQKLAGDLGLNLSKFNDCLESDVHLNKIRSQQSAGAAAGVTGTPGTFINGQLVSGALPYEQITSVIDASL